MKKFKTISRLNDLDELMKGSFSFSYIFFIFFSSDCDENKIILPVYRQGYKVYNTVYCCNKQCFYYWVHHHHGYIVSHDDVFKCFYY